MFKLGVLLSRAGLGLHPAHYLLTTVTSIELLGVRADSNTRKKKGIVIIDILTFVDSTSNIRPDLENPEGEDILDNHTSHFLP